MGRSISCPNPCLMTGKLGYFCMKVTTCQLGQSLHTHMDTQMNSIQRLRDLCNREIARIGQEAYRSYPYGPIKNPPISMYRVNTLLKACDEVFREFDNGVPNTKS